MRRGTPFNSSGECFCHLLNNFPHGPYSYKNRVDNPIIIYKCANLHTVFLHLLCMSAYCGLTIIVSFILSSLAGGMRLPGGIDEDVGNKHYLTNACRPFWT